MSQSPLVQCPVPDCSFISSSQGHLGIHRSKMHKCSVPENIKSVNIVRLFTEEKSYYCCLCNNIIMSFPNFKRHFSTSHKGVTLNVSAKCVVCDREFPSSTGAGVHIKRTHKIGKEQLYPLSPSPVMSFIDYTLSQNNSTLVSSLRPRRSSRISLVNSPLSGVNTRPSTCIISPTVHHDTCDSQFVNTSFSQPLLRFLRVLLPPSLPTPYSLLGLLLTSIVVTLLHLFYLMSTLMIWMSCLCLLPDLPIPHLLTVMASLIWWFPQLIVMIGTLQLNQFPQFVGPAPSSVLYHLLSRSQPLACLLKQRSPSLVALA